MQFQSFTTERSEQDGGRRRNQRNFESSVVCRSVEQAQRLGGGGIHQDRQERTSENARLRALRAIFTNLCRFGDPALIGLVLPDVEPSRFSG